MHTKELQGHEFAKTLDIRLCMINLDSHLTQKFLKIMEVEMGRGCWKFPLWLTNEQEEKAQTRTSKNDQSSLNYASNVRDTS